MADKKEDSEKYIHSIQAEGGRCLEELKYTHLDLKKYYQAFCKTNHDT